MKPPPFAYFRPARLDEALELLAAHGDGAKVLAGGQSLVPLLRLRLSYPESLVDIGRLSELEGITAAQDAAVVGALTRQSAAELHPLVRERIPLLAEALPLIGHAAIRNQGTLGGSLAHADPAAELPAVMVALDAELRVRSAAGERTIPAEEFFLSFLTTALRDEELLTEIRIPYTRTRESAAILETARRPGDFALAGVAVRILMDADRACEARVVAFGVGPCPQRIPGAEAVLVGSRLDDADIEHASREVPLAVKPGSDLHASGDYRQHAVRVLCERALRLARERLG
jgi:carbon-monoxide dehydrogenase medium subunit